MISEELFKILGDFINDILTTFPEYRDKLHPGLMAIHNKEKDNPAIAEVVEHCNDIYPKRFFDILYQKDELLTGGPIYLLPNIDFCELWKLDISDHTRTVIWKYLQLILFSIVNLQKGGDSFGETAKLFEAINETEFKQKLEDTIEQMTDIFNISGGVHQEDASGMQFPNAEELQDHISDILEGNLGNLAREIAQETAEELNSDMENATSVGDVFKKLFRNPGKLMGLIQKVGDRLDGKLQSGEMKESDLIKEASELIEKMHKMPGMKEMHNMLGEMGLPMGNSKVNMNAFQAQLNRNLKTAKTKERMLRKLERRRAAQLQREQFAAAQSTPQTTEPAKKNKKKKKKRRKKGKNKK